VITLCYNTGSYVVETLESIQAQTYPNVQLVVVDDGSSDESVALIREWMSSSGYPVELVQHTSNRGIAAALNTALGLVKGDYVTIVCDDVWDKDRLDTVVKCFEGLPAEVGVLFGDATLIDADSRPIDGLLSPARTVELLDIPGWRGMVPPPGECVIIPGASMRAALYHRCFIPAPSTTVRRAVYDLVGPYDESYAIDDLDLYFRASHAVDFAYLRRPLVNYRRHASNFTTGRSDAYMRALAGVLSRHAASEGSRPRAPVKRHVREEAFRVAKGLLEMGVWRPALRTVRQYYLPNLQPTATCLKETVRLGLVAGRRALMRSMAADA
jgi:glycosyltransferase involved in cell wall biosynthesis